MKSRAETGERTWLEATHCHGVYEMYKSHSWCAKLFWAVVILTCLSMCIWQVSGVIESFASPPHYTTNIFLVDRKHAEFPNITICNFNRASKELDWELYLNQTDGIKDERELLKYIGFTCEETLILCHWSHFFFDCCKYTRIIINQYGKCLVVTPPGDSVSEEGVPLQADEGSIYGLKVIMNPNLHLQYEKALVNNYLDDGFMIAPSFDPYISYIPYPIAVRPNSHAWINLQNRVAQVKKPMVQLFQRSCTQDQKLVINKGLYHSSSCKLDCLQQIMFEACGCIYLAETNGNFTVCSASKWKYCIYPLVMEQGFNDSSPISLCRSKCREPCNSVVEVQASVSNSEYLSPKYRDGMREIIWRNFGEDINFNGMISATIYFSSTTYTIHEKDEKISLFQLVGSVGGLLGLWLGVSIVSIIQALYYFIWYLNRKLNGSK